MARKIRANPSGNERSWRLWCASAKRDSALVLMALSVLADKDEPPHDAAPAPPESHTTCINPVIFQCRGCLSVIGDTLSLFSIDREHQTVILTRYPPPAAALSHHTWCPTYRQAAVRAAAAGDSDANGTRGV